MIQIIKWLTFMIDDVTRWGSKDLETASGSTHQTIWTVLPKFRWPLARSTSERVNEIMFPFMTELRLRDQGRHLRPLRTQGEFKSPWHWQLYHVLHRITKRTMLASFKGKPTAKLWKYIAAKCNNKCQEQPRRFFNAALCMIDNWTSPGTADKMFTGRK